MRTLKYAILGLLMREPLTGYDIARKFGVGLGSFWNAKHSQIYPELKRLDDEGLVTFETVIHGEKLEKKLYTITPQGKEAFLTWLGKDDPLEPTAKDVFRLRTYYSESMSDQELIRHFELQLVKRRAKLDGLQSEMDRKYTGITQRDLTGAVRGDYMVLKSAIMRESTYVQWIEECIRDLKAVQ